MPTLNPHDILGTQLKRVEKDFDVYFYVDDYGWSEDATELFGGDPGRRYSVRMWHVRTDRYASKRNCSLAFNWLLRLERWLSQEFASYRSQFGIEYNSEHVSEQLELRNEPRYRAREYEYPEGAFRKDINWRFVSDQVNHLLDSYDHFGYYRYDFALNVADSSTLKLYGLWPAKRNRWPQDWPTQAVEKPA